VALQFVPSFGNLYCNLYVVYALVNDLTFLR
jgi:hypothetical protein